jgi:hypothetical protein
MNIAMVKRSLFLPGLLALSFAAALAQTTPDLVDARQYGARPVNAWWQYGTTVTGVVGSNEVKAASASTFRNGDGIVIYGAGAAPAVSAAPAAPHITPGISETETVPDAPMMSLTKGTTAYSYSVVARDIHGGLSAASPITTITNGPRRLGQNSIPISRLNLTGKAITATTASPHGLAAGLYEGPLVHIRDSSDSQTFSGWWNVSDVPSPTAITITGTNRHSAAPRNATGGSLAYFTGNQITWKPQPGAWEYVVCARRPGDSSLHVIGVSMPSAGPVGGSYAVATFPDWGAPLIGVNFKLPSYINDHSCTATQSANDYLSTTVVSGGGTPMLTLHDKLANGVSGARALIDAAPGILAAARVAQQNGQTLYIPGGSLGQNFYQLNSTLDLPRNLDVLQVGQLRLGEPIIVNSSTNWRGRGSAAAPQFAWKASPMIHVAEANPGLYVEHGSVDFDTLSIAADQNANQALLMVVDSAWGSTFNYMNLTTGGPNDMTGIAVVVRQSANTTFRYLNFLGGPGQVIDQTWTPLLYMPESQDGSGSTGVWTIEHGMFNRRGILYRAKGGGGLNCGMGPAYIQGSITPFLALENTTGPVNAQVILKRLVMDTSSQAFLALWGTGGSFGAQVDIDGTNAGGMSIEAKGGRPTVLTGVPISELTARDIGSVLGQ